MKTVTITETPDRAWRGGFERSLEPGTVREIRVFDWIAETTGKPYVSCFISLAAWRAARYATDRQGNGEP